MEEEFWKLLGKMVLTGAIILGIPWLVSEMV